MQNYLRETGADRVYVFNGRFAYARGVLRACQSMGVPCFTHDRGQDLQHYALFENSTPLDLAYTEEQIKVRWREAEEDPRRQEVAEKFYFDRANGVVQAWYSFTGKQRAGLLPANWDSNRRNIVIFNSSEDEFEAAGDEWNNKLYRNQQDGLERIIESLNGASDAVHLYLRVHPNLKGLDNVQTRQLAKLKANCFTMISPDDPVSTYTLMKEADKVLTFGSTAGIEAVFWGAASILAGPAYYRTLGGTYNPESHKELVKLLHNDLPPKDKAAALMYGYFLNTFGLPFKYYKALGMNEGTFKGRELRATHSFWQRLGERADRFALVRIVRRKAFRLASRWRVLHSVQLR